MCNLYSMTSKGEAERYLGQIGLDPCSLIRSSTEDERMLAVAERNKSHAVQFKLEFGAKLASHAHLTSDQFR